MKQVVRIRAARLADCTTCQKLGRVPEISIAPGWYLPVQYYQSVVRGRHIFLVAETDHRLVGFLIAEKIVAGFLLQYIVVDKSWRKHGVATGLMTQLDIAARKKGAYFLMTYSVLKSQGMAPLLRKYKYRPGQITREWSKGLSPTSRTRNK